MMASPPEAGEFARGSNAIFGSTYTLTGDARANEITTNASSDSGNAVYAATDPGGPVRSGFFATGSSTRISSGAGFYGAMELSGNLSGYCITLGNATGRSVRYIPNGNGTISAAGYARHSVGDAGLWPGVEGNSSSAAPNTCSGTCKVSASAAMMLRGGSFNDPVTELSIAERAPFTRRPMWPTAEAEESCTYANTDAQTVRRVPRRSGCGTCLYGPIFNHTWQRQRRKERSTAIPSSGIGSHQKA